MIAAEAARFAESLSGNHARSGFGIPRKAHKNRKSVRKRGVSNEQVYVMTGLNDPGTAFASSPAEAKRR